MKVAVIGTGRVGLPFALSLIDAGVEVMGVDLDPRVRQAVNVDRVMPFREPGYDDLLSSGRLHIAAKLSEAEHCDVFVVTVGTPLLGHIETDLSLVTNVITELCEQLRSGQTIIMRSTTAPRTTQYVAALIETRTRFKVGKDVFLACCPERIVEGKAREELRTLPQIIGADDANSAQHAERVFAKLGVETLHCDWATAELVKLFCNVSRYAYFSIINALSMVALDQGVEPHEVMELANYNYPRKLVGKPGFTAGTCLRKDFGMLAENYWSGGLLTEIWRVNESLPKYLVDHARAHCGKLQGKRIVVLGYTFKGDADDIRDSLAPKLIRYLQREAPATIVVSDPFITAQQVEQVPGLVFTADLDAALAGADLVMIAANHSVYAKSREKILDAASRSGARVVDIWNICGQSRVLIDQQTLAAQTLLKVRRPSQRGVAA